MKNATPTSEQKIKIELKRLDRYACIIGVSGVFFLFIFSLLATQFHLWFDFTNTGQIGDTVGGLTAPIIGIFSALLIYLSFRAQIKANYIVQSQIEKQEKSEIEKKELEFIGNLLNELNKEISVFVYKNGNELAVGADAIIQFLSSISFQFRWQRLDEMDFNGETKNQQYLGLLDILDKLIQIVIEANIKASDKEYFQAQLQYLTNYKLTLVDQEVANCKVCGGDHLILPCFLVERFESISDKIDSIA